MGAIISRASASVKRSFWRIWSNNWEGVEWSARQVYTYLTTHHELHHEEEILIVLVDVEELDDVGVVDLFQNVNFVLQPELILLSQLPPRKKHTKYELFIKL